MKIYCITGVRGNEPVIFKALPSCPTKNDFFAFPVGTLKAAFPSPRWIFVLLVGTVKMPSPSM